MSVAAAPVTSKRSLIGLGVALAASFAASVIGGALTRPNLDWYATLTKPGFTPPNGAFPVVWTILFVMMAVAAWLVWRAPGDEGERKTALIWYGIQLVLNVLWSFAFFYMHNPALGFGVIMALLVAILLTIVFFDRLSRPGALLLVPYLLWVGFAAGLNFTIWVLNSGFDFSQAPA
jgi:translocator protein